MAQITSWSIRFEYRLLISKALDPKVRPFLATQERKVKKLEACIPFDTKDFWKSELLISVPYCILKEGEKQAKKLSPGMDRVDDNMLES